MVPPSRAGWPALVELPLLLQPATLDRPAVHMGNRLVTNWWEGS